MLRQFFAVVLIALSTQITAKPGNSHDFHSGKGEIISAMNTTNLSSLNVTSIQDFLLQGTLTETTSTNETETGTFTYQFHDFGIVDIIGEQHTGQLTITTLFWDIVSLSDGISIILSDPPSGLSFEFKVEELNNQTLNFNFEGKTVSLETNSSVPAETLSQIENAIAGSWNINAYPFDVITDVEKCGAFEEMNGAYLAYNFNNNGTYSRLLGSRMVAMEESGIWEVTKDGKYVIFHSTIDGNPENVSGVHVAKIKAVSKETMIISQALEVPQSDFDSLFCTSTKDFEMNKAEATSSIR